MSYAEFTGMNWNENPCQQVSQSAESNFEFYSCHYHCISWKSEEWYKNECL